MTAPTPPRPTPVDDLGQAYAQARALTDDGRAPAASVRAKVLAAAQQVAAEAAARQGAAQAAGRGRVESEARPPLTPVAAPVSNVARGRAWALNLSSWRVRSGAALCAVLVVGLSVWRFDASRRLAGDTQLASADAKVMEMKVVDAPVMDMAPPKNLPSPAAAPVTSYAVEPPSVTAPAAAPEVGAAPASDARQKRGAPDQEVVVAQAEPAYRANSVPAPRTQARMDDRAAFAPPPPFKPALAESPGMDATAPATAMAPAPVATAAAAASAPDGVVVAAVDAPQRVEIAGSSIRSLGSEAARGTLESARKALPAPADKLAAPSLRALPTPLHVAARNDDVDTLRKLLADPATRVDATDALGRTPLLLAVAAQRVAAVRLLLAAGADPDHADHAGATPRSVARTGANAEIAALLAAPH